MAKQIVIMFSSLVTLVRLCSWGFKEREEFRNGVLTAHSQLQSSGFDDQIDDGDVDEEMTMKKRQ